MQPQNEEVLIETLKEQASPSGNGMQKSEV